MKVASADWSATPPAASGAIEKMYSSSAGCGRSGVSKCS